MSINFDFEDLEAFLAVKETGSFHLAAERLALSQSAITRRMQKLEAALDSKLFERTTRKVKPTLAAKRLEARAEAILEDTYETVRAMRDDSVAFAHQRSLVVTLAILPTLIGTLVPPAVAAMRAQGHPVRLRLLDLAANEVAEAVAAGEADLGVGALPGLDPGLTFRPLLSDPMVVALPAGHDLARADTVQWDQLAGEPLILPARRTGNRVLIDDAAARIGVNLRWVLEAERSTTAATLVAGGAGIAILPLSAVKDLRDDRVIRRRLGTPETTRPVGLLSRVGQAETPGTVALKAAICAAV